MKHNSSRTQFSDHFFLQSFSRELQLFFEEDDLYKNAFLLQTLPQTMCKVELRIKSNLVLCGLPYFVSAFQYVAGHEVLHYHQLAEQEGKNFQKGDVIHFEMPFHILLLGERVALNLLQRASSIATFTGQFVNALTPNPHGIKILDTRKTTPGLRTLEKYAVRMGGGHNHRFSQADCFMIKDNHKFQFGNLEKAVEYFRSLGHAYQSLIVEVHSFEELAKAVELKLPHVMLDNFSLDMIGKAIEIKPNFMTYEISGGVTLANIHQYNLAGVDGVSIGALTHSAPHVDLSLKYFPIQSESSR